MTVTDEPATGTTLPPVAIIDAHHHIWRLGQTPWLNGPPVPRIFGEYQALRRDYTIEDFLADCRPSRVAASVIEQTVDLFGPSRCMFGSNFPIEKLWTDYSTLTSVFWLCLSRLTASEQQAILQHTAAQVYSVGDSGSPLDAIKPS